MTKDVRVYLDDVIESSLSIATYIQTKSKEAFDKDEQLQDAVVRRLEIIGEAIKHLPIEFREQHPQVAWKKATGMRDVLIHMYDEVDTDQVWVTITEILPPFALQIKELLKTLEGK